jgi:hypothetical protein
MTETFDADWLELREGHDFAARSIELAMLLNDHLPARPRLIDLGCGTGSLFRWLAPLIGRAQVWIFADADADLLHRALDDTQDWAQAMGWSVSTPGRAMLIHADTGTWRIETKRIDLAGALTQLPLSNVDAVLCSALLDLVSADWVQRFVALLRVPLLTCLNVDGRDTLMPADPADVLVRRGFRQDQGRDKGFGPALGPRLPAVLVAALSERGFTVRSAASDWRIGPAEQDMLEELVIGHGAAASRQLPRHRPAIDAWTARRINQIERARLRLRIGHRDILALPPTR